VLDFENILKI